MEALVDKARALVASSDVNTCLAAVLLGLAVAFLVLRVATGGAKAPGVGPGGRIRRAMSFTSAACAEGPMPDHAGMHPSDPIINAVVVFRDGAPSRAAVEEAIRPLLYYERFRSRKVKVGEEWFWEVLEESEVVPAKHVLEDGDFSAKDVDGLFRHLEVWAQKPLHVTADAPQFEFAILRNKAGPKAPSAVIARVNHAIGDGISLAKMIPVIFKDVKGEPLPPTDKFRRREAGFKPSLKNPFSILSSLITVLGTPMTAFDTDIGLTVPDKRKIVFTRRRAIVRVPTIKLSFIKAVKTAASVTVNDVIYAATAGAIHRLRAEHGDAHILHPESHARVQTRALLPVALPRAEGDPVRGLRNKWSFASVAMPIGVKGPLERLRASHDIMNKLKNSPIVIVQNMFENIVGRRLPWPMNKQVAYDCFVRHTCVFSNVPGPDLPVSFAGKEVEGLYMVYANLIPQIGALSLNGRIFTCMLLDDEVTPDARKLGEYFIDELLEMSKAANLALTKADILAE